MSSSEDQSRHSCPFRFLLSCIPVYNINIMTEQIDKRRVWTILNNPLLPAPVIYWMSRDQRSEDNWGLLYAQEQALELKQPIIVIFTLVDDFLNAPLRHYAFMLRGLMETREVLRKKNIPLILLRGNPAKTLPRFLRKNRPALLVCDFDPLKIKQKWQMKITAQCNCRMVEVDSHNIVPARNVSGKQEYGARTLRPRIHRLLSDFLAPFPKLKKHPFPSPLESSKWDASELLLQLNTDNSISEVKAFRPGAPSGKKALRSFLRERISKYADDSNDPNSNSVSGLSPWLHFGQISAQRIALEVLNLPQDASSDAFLEQLIIRRELSDNFCLYNSDYDSPRCFPEWAKETHRRHLPDRREHLYTPEQFENADTQDPLWNAAQRSIVRTGYLHGYLRMYWAKKILEWSPDPEAAMETAIRLNDRYLLDGRDPNGYTGIAWSIGGIHDRAWPERAVFGKIRSMTFSGCRRKFDVDAFIRRYPR